MTRMHPQDLRAIVAAIIGTQDYPPYREPGFDVRIREDADLLLAELERTSKPEDDKQASLQSYIKWEDEIMSAAKAAGWNVLSGPIQEWIPSLAARTKAAEAEVARLKAKLKTWEDGCVCTDISRTGVERRERERIIEALSREPRLLDRLSRLDTAFADERTEFMDRLRVAIEPEPKRTCSEIDETAP